MAASSTIVIPHPGRLALRGLPQIVEASVVPPLLFFTILQSAGKTWALFGCLLWSYTAIARRAVAGRGLPGILVVGAVLMTLRTITSYLTGSVVIYFLQPVLGSVMLAVTFFVSVACGRPMMLRLVQDFCPLTPEVAAYPPVRAILSRLTLAWACVHLVNAGLTASLLFTTPLGVFLILKAFGVYLITALAVAGSVLWGRHAGRAYGMTLLFEKPSEVTAPRVPVGVAWGTSV